MVSFVMCYTNSDLFKISHHHTKRILQDFFFIFVTHLKTVNIYVSSCDFIFVPSRLQIKNFSVFLTVLRLERNVHGRRMVSSVHLREYSAIFEIRCRGIR